MRNKSLLSLLTPLKGLIRGGGCLPPAVGILFSEVDSSQLGTRKSDFDINLTDCFLQAFRMFQNLIAKNLLKQYTKIYHKITKYKKTI